MQAPRPLDHRKLTPDCIDALADGAPVGLDLRLAGAAQKAETAPLAFKVRPRPDKPALLIGKSRQFDLQPAFLAARPIGKNLKNEPGAVENLRVPGLFEVALLDRAQHVVDNRNRDIPRLDNRSKFLDFPRPQKGRGPGLGERNCTAETDVKTDCVCKTGRFRKALPARQARGRRNLRCLLLRKLPDWNDDNRTRCAKRPLCRRASFFVSGAILINFAGCELFQRF